MNTPDIKARGSIKQMLLRQEKLRRSYSFALSFCTLTAFLLCWTAISLITQAASISLVGSSIKAAAFISLLLVFYRSIQTARKLSQLYKDPSYIRRVIAAQDLPDWWQLFRSGH